MNPPKLAFQAIISHPARKYILLITEPFFRASKAVYIFYPHLILFFIFLLCIFLNYISNAIPKVSPPPPLPYPPIPIFWPWRSPVLGHIKFACPWAFLSSDGRLGHLLICMQLETRAPGYWLVHNVVPPIGLQISLAPWILSLAPPLGAL